VTCLKRWAQDGGKSRRPIFRPGGRRLCPARRTGRDLALIARELPDPAHLEPTVATAFWDHLQALTARAGQLLHKLALRSREAPALLQQVATMGSGSSQSAGSLAWSPCPSTATPAVLACRQ
jgi:hypothetical protein